MLEMTKKHTHELQAEQTELEHLNFLSLVEYKGEEFLCVIDNVGHDTVGVYTLDEIEKYGVNKKKLLEILHNWFFNRSHAIPISIEFNRLGISVKMNNLYKILEKTYITRIVGRTFNFASEEAKIKRRKVMFAQETQAIELPPNTKK